MWRRVGLAPLACPAPALAGESQESGLCHDTVVSPNPVARPKTRTKRVRLDQLLVERGLVETRSRAQALVLAGKVRVGGATARAADRKPGDAGRYDDRDRRLRNRSRTSAVAGTSWPPRSMRSGSTRPG